MIVILEERDLKSTDKQVSQLQLSDFFISQHVIKYAHVIRFETATSIKVLKDET